MVKVSGYPLGSGVVDVFVGRAQAGGDRRHIDDAAALPAVLGRHAQIVLGAQNGCQHIGLEGSEDTKFGHFVDTGLVSHGAGVVHQCGDPSRRLGIDPVKQRDHFIFDADIGTHGDGFSAQCADFIQHALGRLFISLIVDADPVTLFGGQQGCGGTDARLRR